MTGRISMSARRELVTAIAERYRTAERVAKGPDSQRTHGRDRVASQASGAGAQVEPQGDDPSPAARARAPRTIGPQRGRSGPRAGCQRGDDRPDVARRSYR